MIAYTSPSNAFILKIKPQNDEMKHEQKEDIVLVDREEINKFFERVKVLENQLDQLSNMTAIKLEDERKKYNESLEENSLIFKQ